MWYNKYKLPWGHKSTRYKNLWKIVSLSLRSLEPDENLKFRLGLRSCGFLVHVSLNCSWCRWSWQCRPGPSLALGAFHTQSVQSLEGVPQLNEELADSVLQMSGTKISSPAWLKVTLVQPGSLSCAPGPARSPGSWSHLVLSLAFLGVNLHQPTYSQPSTRG